jgi:hypothetical protein
MPTFEAANSYNLEELLTEDERRTRSYFEPVAKTAGVVGRDSALRCPPRPALY